MQIKVILIFVRKIFAFLNKLYFVSRKKEKKIKEPEKNPLLTDSTTLIYFYYYYTFSPFRRQLLISNFKLPFFVLFALTIRLNRFKSAYFAA